MAKGMFVDASICTGCKACQVACKEWNGLDPEPTHFKSDPETHILAINFTGNSYDNTGELSSTDWRHVRFIERINQNRKGSRWLFMSDSCKHCTDAGCLNVCPIKAIDRDELGNVVIRQDRCKGLKACNKGCPYGVAKYSAKSHTSRKCTLCDDRIHNGQGTACAKACPTGSIRFGEVAELRKIAAARLAQLKKLGESKANIYGSTQAKGLNVFYLLMDKPSVYGLPDNPRVPQRTQDISLGSTVIKAMTLGIAALVAFRERGFRRQLADKKQEDNENER
jgi:formate dehydrogenase iron-sulfur subunit